MNIRISKDEIINFVMQSSDADNLIIATFIAGMQARKNIAQCHPESDKSFLLGFGEDMPMNREENTEGLEETNYQYTLDV